MLVSQDTQSNISFYFINMSVSSRIVIYVLMLRNMEQPVTFCVVQHHTFLVYAYIDNCHPLLKRLINVYVCISIFTSVTSKQQTFLGGSLQAADYIPAIGSLPTCISNLHC